jgi:hypothetical protein
LIGIFWDAITSVFVSVFFNDSGANLPKNAANVDSVVGSIPVLDEKWKIS